MTGTAADVVLAITWLWLGMVLAISFVEAPLKFRAPGVDLRTGLAIGRLVFRVLNTIEAVFALVVAGLLAGGTPDPVTGTAGVVAVVILVVQLVAVRPLLSRRSDAVLASGPDEEAPRSQAHWWYVGLELVKVAALATLGVALLV